MQSRAAIRYAKAMYDIASEENFIKEVYKDMSLIKELCSDSLDFKSLLSNSQINYHDKKKAILSLLENSNALTEKLIDLLIHNKRVSIIGDIAISFIHLYNKHNNIKEATLITASPIDEDLKSIILSKINISDSKSISLTNIIDSSIIGGFIIRFDGKEYNASVKQNLNNLKKELTN
jgi:F-type H+-transporting ATPase subunit delta